jgi:shikimate kinase
LGVKNSSMVATPILFIGPVRAGKSTLAKLVSLRLNLPLVPLDDIKERYYREAGYNNELAKQIRMQDGFLAFMFYRMLFEVHAVECVLRDHYEAVIDCGAGVGPFENTQDLDHIQNLFQAIPNIFYLIPAENIKESLRILHERDLNPPTDVKFDINEHFLRHPGYRLLTKHVIYSAGKTPEETCLEVIALLR